ncbi:spermidine acetyltransferase [Paenibacillus macerans]|nr:spermidine acetyltransferase [Paenibacillus macerans]
MIRLQRINKDNWEECAALRPGKEQQQFIAPNVYSIAEAQFLHGFSSMAVYKHETMIGYALYGIDPDDNNYWMYRFMIDRRFQGKGYGFMAVCKIIEEIRNRQDRTDVLILGYKPENERARRLYLKAGFVEDGLAPWGEVIAKYRYV